MHQRGNWGCARALPFRLEAFEGIPTAVAVTNGPARRGSEGALFDRLIGPAVRARYVLRTPDLQQRRRDAVSLARVDSVLVQSVGGPRMSVDVTLRERLGEITR